MNPKAPSLDPLALRLRPGAQRATRWPLAVALLSSLALLAVGWGDDAPRRLQFAWLASVLLPLSLGLGALFFVLLHHLVGAGWSVALRRLAEQTAATLPWSTLLLAPVVLPTLFGHGALFPWADPHHVAEHELLQHKQAYLNAPFFTLRWLLYAGAWTLLARWFTAQSEHQDRDADPRRTLDMQRRSAPAMLVFALTTTFAAFDFVMSLAPEWYSTIFGVYLFAGAVVGFLAFLILLALGLERAGALSGVLRTEHLHDLGRLLFAFVFFWGYIAFSQYLLIWYANIPEETAWYRVRQESGWAPLSLSLVIAHFLVPFAALLSRHTKRRRGSLAFLAGWVLVMHAVDLVWLVLPALGGGPRWGALELAALLAALSLWALALLRRLARGPLVAVGDPRLHESLTYSAA